jgi:hypothetical protein
MERLRQKAVARGADMDGKLLWWWKRIGFLLLLYFKLNLPDVFLLYSHTGFPSCFRLRSLVFRYMRR